VHALVLGRLWDGQRLLRGWQGGVAGGEAVLDDYAQMARAALTLYELTGKGERLDEARALLRSAATGFRAEDGGWRMARTPAAPGMPIARADRDRALGSGAAVLVESLARLSYLSGETELHSLAEQSLPASLAVLRERPLDHAGMLVASDTLFGAVQVILLGDRADEATQGLLSTVWTTALPGRAVQTIKDSSALPTGHPAQGKGRLGGVATAYVCVGSVCSLPVTSPQALRTRLLDLRGLALGGPRVNQGGDAVGVGPGSPGAPEGSAAALGPRH
jgi:uncharacterized protein YyaL (SSP411 family)